MLLTYGCCGSFVVVVSCCCGGGGSERKIAGCGCGSCFLWVSRGATYSILCAKIMWSVGILGKHIVGLGSRKSRV